MNPNRIFPDLQSSLLCEDVRQESNGNFFVVGVINAIRVPRLPITAFKLCLFNRWTAGVGQFVEQSRLLGPDQTTVLREGKVKFQLRDPSNSTTNVTVFGQVEFSQAGVYYVEVSVDEILKLRYPFQVMVVQPPQQGQNESQAPSQQPPTDETNPPQPPTETA